MGDIAFCRLIFTFHRLIFILSVVIGIVVPLPTLVRAPLVAYGMQGLLVDQQITMEEMQFQRELLLRELDKIEREMEQERQPEMRRRDGSLPALPEEGY